MATDPFSASIIPFEVPEQMRAFAEKGVSGASEYSAKLMEMMKANSTATLDFAQALIGVKTPSEAMELWSAHAKKQFEALTAHSKELAELTQKVVTETVEPIKANASKLFKPAA
jgi:phasin